MKHYVNMNVDIRKGGRNAVKMSIEDFKREAEHVMKEFALEQGLDLTHKSNRMTNVRHLTYRCANRHKDNAKSKFVSKLYNDIWNNKYKFDNENIECVGDVKMLRAVKIRLYPNKTQEQTLNKALVNDKQVVFIDRFYPSSKTCSVCGYKKQDLRLSDREWVCPKCGTKHDRDINAAVNILLEGQRILATE